MLVLCPALPEKKDWEDKLEADGSMTLGNFTKVYGALQQQYNGCAIRMDCLVEAVQGDSKTAKSSKCTKPKGNKEVK